MTTPKITLLHHTPLEVCSHAIRTCWSSFDKSDCGGEKDRELINRVGNIYKHACYDVETELLTKNGWKKIGDIDVGESVMTMQKDSKIMEFKQVKNTFKYHHSGNMIKYKNRHTDLLVTENHKMLASIKTTKNQRKLNVYDLYEARELIDINHKILRIGKYKTNQNKFYTYDDNFFRLVGFFIGDGFYKYGNNLLFHIRKQRKINYLKSIANVLDRASDNYYVPITKDQREIFLSCYNDNREKTIPFDLELLTQQQIELILDGLNNSDGGIDKRSNKYHYFSTSRELVDKIQIMCLMIGICCNIKMNSKNCKVFRISYDDKITSEFNRLKKECSLYAKSKIVDYSGYVYCVEVDNHILLVRRNGKTSICGNSTLEHLSYTFFIQGISRACLQELARHRIASYSVKSSRYTLAELKRADISTLELASKFIKLTDNDKVNQASHKALQNLKELLLDSSTTNDMAKYAMPECYLTELTWTINARSLQNFLTLRTSKHALWEIQELALAIYEALPQEHKYLFDKCVGGK